MDNVLTDNGNGFKIDIAQWRGETTQSMKDIKDDLTTVKSDIKTNGKELQNINVKIDIVIRELGDRIAKQEKEFAKKEIEYVERFTRALNTLQTTLEADIHKRAASFQEEIAHFKDCVNEQIKTLEINYTAESTKRATTRGIVIALVTAIIVLAGQNFVKLLF